MTDFSELWKELDEQLEQCDPFFQEPLNKALVRFYIMYECEKRLGKKKYNWKVTPTEKGDIMVDIISSRKRLDPPLVITKRKIRRHAKAYELPD